jgi:hypothetical protein
LLAVLGRSFHLSGGGARTAEIWTITRARHRREHLGVALLVVVAIVAAAVAFAWPWMVILAFASAAGAQTLHWRLFFVTAVPLAWRAEVVWSLPPSLAGKEG